MKIYSNPQQQKAFDLLKDSGLPTSDLNTKKLENFLYLGDPDDPVGIIGLEIFDTVALLRSLAVSKGARGKGHGRTLVSAMETYAENKNIRELYLLTDTAEDFFKKLNYKCIQRESAPDAIKTTSEFSSVCKKSAILMTKKLSGGYAMIGKCLCGAIQFKIKSVPNLYQCHCSQCRRQSGTFSNAATLVYKDDFSWLAGEDKISKFKLEDGFTSRFCSICGSPVPNPLRNTDKVWVPAGTLPGEMDSKVVVHIYTGSKASWENEITGGRQYEEMPDFVTLYNLLHAK